MKIIDIHVHHRWIREDDRPTEQLTLMKRLAHRNEIKHVMLVGVAGAIPPQPSPAEISNSNSYTIRLMEEDPGFFIGACYLNPEHDEDFIRAEATRCKRAGMRFIKLWIAVNARDPRLDRVARVACELDLPIIFHAWYKTTGNLDQESNGADMADLGRRWPDCRIVMAHLPGVRHRGVLDIADLPNVSIDTCGGQPGSELVEYAVRYLGADRVLYGSDYPIRDFPVQLGRVLGADISEADREKILWHNAVKLLKLDR